MDNSSTPTQKIMKTEEDDKGVGNKLSDFKIICELGRGSYGVVNKVLSLVDNNEYVMKKINMKHIKLKHQKEALKEAQILRRVRHPNIIRYYTSFVEDEHLYIIMEYAEGGDLAVLIKQHKEKKKFFSEREVWDLAWELCQAIDYLHNNNIIHRDIKTLNIFLTKDRHVKLGDLGVSKIVSSAASLQGTRVGTPLYLSPELVKQQPYDYKVDIWALGCVLYHIIALEPPFYGDNLITLGYNIVHKYPKPLSNSYSPKLTSIVMKFLEKNPATRPKISEVLDLFPSRYRHPMKLPSNELSSQYQGNNSHNPSITNENVINPPASEKKADRIETYKGNSVKLLRIDDKNFKGESDREIVVKRSNLLNAPNTYNSHNPGSPKRPSTSIGLSSRLSNNFSSHPKEEGIPNLKRNNFMDLNRISFHGNEAQANKLDPIKSTNQNPSNSNELPELKQPTIKKILDTESTAENKPKAIQNSLLNQGGNDTTLSVKNTREAETQKKYKSKESDVIIEENMDKNQQNDFVSQQNESKESAATGMEISPKITFSNNYNSNRPYTSDASRRMMNPVIKSTSPRIPIKPKIHSVLSQRPAILESNDMSEKEPGQQKIEHNPSASNLHHDIRIRPVSAHLIKRVTYQNPKQGVQVPFISIESAEINKGEIKKLLDDDDEGDISLDHKDKEDFPKNKFTSIERPKSAIFLNRLQNQVIKKAEGDNFASNKVDFLKNGLPNKLKEKDLYMEKMKHMISSSSGFDKLRHQSTHKATKSPYTLEEVISAPKDQNPQDDEFVDRNVFGVSRQSWMRYEVINNTKKSEVHINYHKDKNIVPEIKPQTAENTRPKTSAGIKKKLTIHDLLM